MEIMSISQEQFDMLLSTMLVLTCCIAFCLGWLSHEFGAK